MGVFLLRKMEPIFICSDDMTRSNFLLKFKQKFFLALVLCDIGDSILHFALQKCKTTSFLPLRGQKLPMTRSNLN